MSKSVIAILLSWSLSICAYASDTVENKMQADKYSVLDSVTEDGGNLRQVLASLDIVTYLLPLGPNVTFFAADSGGNFLLKGGVFDTGLTEFRQNIRRICRGDWTDVTMQQDVMTGSAVPMKRIIPPQELLNFVPGNNDASCGQAFSWGGSIRGGFIFHRVPQPFIWKTDRLAQPVSKDELPPDGVIPKDFFKPEGRYPPPLRVVAWANRICELRGGNQISMAFLGGVPAIRASMDKIVEVFRRPYAPQNFYLYCNATSDEGFLIRVVTDKLGVQGMAVQRNRDLKSVGF